MADEAFLKEIQEKKNDFTEEELERFKREIVNEEGINEDLHLLLLGRPGVGKSTFAGELTGGKIKGSSGPSGGTKRRDIPGEWKYIKTEKVEEANSTKLDGSDTKKVYFVHETVGLRAKVDLDEMKREVNEVCEQSRHCVVFLCLGWEDRIDDINTQRAFDVCHSLGMWGKVTVVITQCDIISEDSDSTSEESIGIKRMECDWKKSIAVKLESMNVEQLEIRKITEKIILYPKKETKPVHQGSHPTDNNEIQEVPGPNENIYDPPSPCKPPQKKGLCGLVTVGIVGGLIIAGAFVGGVIRGLAAPPVAILELLGLMLEESSNMQL